MSRFVDRGAIIAAYVGIGVAAPDLAANEHHGMALVDAEIIYHGVCAGCIDSPSPSPSPSVGPGTG